MDGSRGIRRTTTIIRARETNPRERAPTRGTSRRGSGADSVRPVAVGRKKAGPAAKNGFGKRADSRRATRKRAVASRIGPMRVARKRNVLPFPRNGSDAHLFVWGKVDVCVEK